MVDFGTATVFDAINEDGVYVGGAISPGIGISTDALCSIAPAASRGSISSARRPRSAPAPRPRCRAGILFGYVGLVEGIIARFRVRSWAAAKVVATGGWAPRIARGDTAVLDVVDEDLILWGLRELYYYNAEGTL